MASILLAFKCSVLCSLSAKHFSLTVPLSKQSNKLVAFWQPIDITITSNYTFDAINRLWHETYGNLKPNLVHINTKNTYIHTQLALQPFSRDYGLVSHTTHVVCAYFKREWWGLKLTSNNRFLRTFFMADLFTLRVFARNLLRVNSGRNIFFIFRFDARSGIQIGTLSLISQHSKKSGFKKIGFMVRQVSPLTVVVAMSSFSKKATPSSYS